MNILFTTLSTRSKNPYTCYYITDNCKDKERKGKYDTWCSGIHQQVPQAINACTEIGQVEAVGVMETFSLCAAVIAADASVKAAEVDLIEVRLGRGLGGKSFIVLTGDVAAVRASIDAGTAQDEVQGLMSRSVVIPSPHPDIIKSLL